MEYLPARPRAGDRDADRSRRVGLHGPGAGRPEGAAGSEGGLGAPRRRLMLPYRLPTNSLFRTSRTLSARHGTVRLAGAFVGSFQEPSRCNTSPTKLDP